MKKLLFLLSLLAFIPVFAQYQSTRPEPAPSLNVVNAGHNRVVVKVNGRSIFDSNPGTDVKFNMDDYADKAIRITVDIMQRELFGWSIKTTFFYDCTLKMGDQWQLMLGDGQSSTTLQRTYPVKEPDKEDAAGGRKEEQVGVGRAANVMCGGQL